MCKYSLLAWAGLKWNATFDGSICYFLISIFRKRAWLQRGWPVYWKRCKYRPFQKYVLLVWMVTEQKFPVTLRRKFQQCANTSQRLYKRREVWVTISPVWQSLRNPLCGLADLCWVHKQKVVGLSPIMVNVSCPWVTHFGIIYSSRPRCINGYRQC